MISKLLKPIILSMLTVTIGLPVISFAAKKGNEQLRIQAGIPKRTDKAIFSSLIAWRQEGGVKNKVKLDVPVLMIRQIEKNQVS